MGLREQTRKAVRGRGTGGLDDPPVYYVSTVEIEDTVRRPFEVAIDGMVVSGVQSVRSVGKGGAWGRRGRALTRCTGLANPRVHGVPGSCKSKTRTAL